MGINTRLDEVIRTAQDNIRAGGAIGADGPEQSIKFCPPIAQYVCGFLFSEDRLRVVLIRKGRPEWQKGRLNGVGGSIEPGETPLEAMRREFAEEAGKTVQDWQNIAILRVPLVTPPRGGIVYFFAAFDSLDGVQSMTDERVTVRTVSMVVSDPTMLPNLRIMLPLALDTSGLTKPVEFYDEGA